MSDISRLTNYRRNINVLLERISKRDQTIEALRRELVASRAAAQRPVAPAPRQRPPSPSQSRGRAAVACWDLCHNPAGRAVVIYDLLARNWQVDLIGPLWTRFGGKVWPPIAASGRSIHGFPCETFEDFLPQAVTFAAQESYDLVVVIKPRLPGLVLGAMIQKTNDCALVLDIDDFELSFFPDETPLPLDALEEVGVEALAQPFEELATRACETIIRDIPSRIVSNVALRARYGGIVVRHARDEALFHPDRFDRKAQRQAMGIQDRDFAIVFVGTPRPHKGIYDVARALHEIDDHRFVFHIVGDITDQSIKGRLAAFNRARIVLHPGCDMDELPAKIAAADAVVLLQDPDHPISQYQIPAKISDATSFGLPVLATNVPPLTDLFHSGLLIPSSASSLKADLERLMEDRDTGRTLEKRSDVRAAFLGELGEAVNAMRLDAAVNEAQDHKTMPPGLARLLDLSLKTYGMMRQTAGVQASPRAAAPSNLPMGNGSPPPDIVMFWKQNDSGLYGRRPDLLLKYMQRSGRIGRILQFDAPQPFETLRRLTDGSRVDPAERLVLRNIFDDQFHIRDDHWIARRTFIWSAKETVRQLFPKAGRRQGDVIEFVRSEMAECGIDPANAIAWVCPVVFDFPAISAAIPFRATVGDLIDDQRTFDMKDSYRARVAASYEGTLPGLDLAITNCQPVAEAFANLTSNIHVVPNGAELPENPAGIPASPAILSYPRPIIGYVGNLRDRFDWALLAATARHLPDASFVIVGGGARSEDLVAIRGIPNIHMHGPVPYDHVQSCIRSFDVAIMPHLKTDQTRRMNPLKIYNYVALHRPVVTTPVDNIDEGLSA